MSNLGFATRTYTFGRWGYIDGLNNTQVKALWANTPIEPSYYDIIDFQRPIQNSMISVQEYLVEFNNSTANLELNDAQLNKFGWGVTSTPSIENTTALKFIPFLYLSGKSDTDRGVSIKSALLTLSIIVKFTS